MARLLIAKGADINPKASRGKYRGWTPLRLAQEWRRKDMVNLLKQHGAKK
ncbi:MAG: hypothetical protein GTO24_15270 [candidate division Zixibacteria bacterium]|nr:hypothetical protein [candidate division Zixibacteria bacterium]